MRYTAGHRDQTRRRILDAARRLFAERGYAATSIGDVMADAGLTRGGFYRHFASKEALYAQAVAAEAGRARADEGPRPAIDPRWAAWLAEPPLALMAADACSDTPAVRAAARRRFWDLVEQIRASVGEAADGPGQARAVTALVVGALALAQALPDAAERDALLRDCQRAAERLGDGWPGVDAGFFWSPLPAPPAGAGPGAAARR